MSKMKRRRFTPEQKAQAVLRHVQDGVPVSQICDELQLHPNQFYQWHKQAMANLARAFEPEDRTTDKRREQQLSALESQVQRKDSVIAELLSDHLALKKSLGEI